MTQTDDRSSPDEYVIGETYPLAPPARTEEHGHVRIGETPAERWGRPGTRLADDEPDDDQYDEPVPDAELYDARLAEAVTHFQERHGIEPDGRVGAETLTELNVPAEERRMAILLNLDRWRWLPRDLGERYVLVNVAAFELAVMEDDEPVLRMNVVVGKEGRNTPFFQDTLEYVVVNPYWNVPQSILERDIMPVARRDPGYLARNGYEVLPGGRVRQRPGSNNSLGAVKFLFPNDMNVYLHDTPAKHLFRRTTRAFSSGCIRVEKPDELAEYLLRTSTSRSPGTYRTLRDSGREQWVQLEEKVPIYILYFTAWVDGDGSVRFYRDVYERDGAISEVARIALAPRPQARVIEPAPFAAGDLTGQ